MDQGGCNEVVRKSILPSVHTPIISSGELYACRFCLISFTSKEDFQLHIDHESIKTIQEASETSPIITCTQCNAEFLTFKGMRQHFGKIHKLERRSKCKICKRKFKNNYAVKFHIRQVHEKSTQIQCVLCTEYKYNKYCYLQHFKKCSMRFFTNLPAGEKDSIL